MSKQTTLSIAILLAGVACGGAGAAGGDYGTGPGPTNNPPKTNPGGTSNPNLVTLVNEAFNPTAVSVTAGTTVTWTWAPCSSDPGGYGGYGGGDCPSHNVTFDDGSNIASQTQTAGEFHRTFDKAGIYKYHCTIHGTAMSGQIEVK